MIGARATSMTRALVLVLTETFGGRRSKNDISLTTSLSATVPIALPSGAITENVPSVMKYAE
jgi:hypothetical protein